MNKSTTATEDDEAVQISEPNVTTTFPLNITGEWTNSSTSPELPSPMDAGSLTNFTNSTFNSSDPFNDTETNSSVFQPLWGLLQNNWNRSTFGNRGGTFPGGGLASNSTDPTDITPTTPVSGPITTWEGYILGIFCLGTVMLFIFAPAWYLDQRRHLAFVGRERRAARSRRGRRRRRQRLRRLLAQDGPPNNDDPPAALLTEDYILSMLLTRPIETSDLLLEEKDLPETPIAVNVHSDKTEDTATTSASTTNKDHQGVMKDDDDESYADDLVAEEDSVSIDDEDADCCAICLQGYKIGEEICYQTTEQSPCPHQFHRDCLVPWLLKHNVCPCCRVQYLPLPQLLPETTKDTVSEESELTEAVSLTSPSASLEIQPLSISHSGGDDDCDSDNGRRSTAPIILDVEVGSDEKESLEGESSSEPTDVDLSIPLDDDDDSLPCSTRSESDTEQVVITSSEEVPIITEELNGDESGHQEEPPIFLDVTVTPSSPPEALLRPSSLECDETSNRKSMASEEYNNETEADIMDLEAQMQLTTAIFDQQRGCFGLGKDFDTFDADTGDKDSERDNASPHDDAEFSVPTPERRLSA